MFRPKAKRLMILLRQISNKIHTSHPTCDACKNYSTKTKKTKGYVQKLPSSERGGGRDWNFKLYIGTDSTDCNSVSSV
jgi:hypothetical protein